MRTPRTTGLRLGLYAALLVLSGCSGESASRGGQDAADLSADGSSRVDASPRAAQLLPTQTPSDVADLLQSLHQERSYSRIANLVVADRRDATIAALLAIDGVLDANEVLHKAAEKRFHGALPGHWNLAVLENNLGPFSADVRIISERIDNDQAMVTLQEGDNLPLYRAQFVLVAGEWLYQSEPTPAWRVRELNRLARMLHDVRQMIAGDAPYWSVNDAFFYRVLPQIARIDHAADTVVAAVDEPGEP